MRAVIVGSGVNGTVNAFALPVREQVQVDAVFESARTHGVIAIRIAQAEGDPGGGVGVSTGSGRIASRCQRSSEIQRSVIAPNNAKKMTSTMRRSVFRRSFCTELFPQPGYNCSKDAQHA